MDEVEQDRRIRERMKSLENRMMRRFTGAMIFSMIAIAEAGGVVYGQVENTGEFGWHTGVEGTGFVLGALLALKNRREYKLLESSLSSLQEERAAVRDSLYQQAAAILEEIKKPSFLEGTDLSTDNLGQIGSNEPDDKFPGEED